MALKGNQKKLDKNNNNRIDAQDFKILKAEKAKGRGMGLQDENIKPGKVMKARVGKSIKKDPTKTVNPFEKKSSKFMERRKKLAGVKSLAGKAGRIGIAIGALGAAGAGAAKLGQTIGRKIDEMKKKPEQKPIQQGEKRKKMPGKMGGGMMNKPMGYSKGGGADSGTVGEMKSRIGVAMNKAKRLRSTDRLTERDIEKAKSLVKGKMGGGMIAPSQRPGYSKGTMVKARGCKLGRTRPTKIT